MVIFHSYVKLPEGKSFAYEKNSEYPSGFFKHGNGNSELKGKGGKTPSTDGDFPFSNSQRE